MAEIDPPLRAAVKAFKKIKGIEVGKMSVVRKYPFLKPHRIGPFLEHIGAVIGLKEQHPGFLGQSHHLGRCLSCIGDNGVTPFSGLETVAYRVGGIVECREDSKGKIIQVVGEPRGDPYPFEKSFLSAACQIQILGGEYWYLKLIGKGFHTCYVIPVDMGQEYILDGRDIKAENLCPAAELGK